ncbi:MAG TPA: MerR family transcriptional regulator [Steroidobacteraceae bacterium]|nr:MerR family transcriptional regulator [Steroidobacteraceae bacterium]
MFSIKAVSQATGLSVETLRAWERRYGIVAPVRDDLGRRVYRPEDVLRLRRLREATDRGHPISRLARLDDEALAALLEGPVGESPDSASAPLVERILAAAQAFRVEECEQALALAVAMLPPPRLIREVLRPVLLEVGERWHRGEMSIAQERLVSSVVRRQVATVLDTFGRSARRATIVFATLPGERHELGLLMAALICASHGFGIQYLGADLPAAEIARFARQVNAAVVALSVVLLDSIERVPAELAVLAQGLPDGTAVWLGGAAVRGLDRDALPPQCVAVQDERDLQQRLEMLTT